MSCWELVCHWQALPSWGLVHYMCPDGSRCSTHTLVRVRVSHRGFALVGFSVFCTYSAVCWYLALWLCPTRSSCVACVLLGVGVSGVSH